MEQDVQTEILKIKNLSKEHSLAKLKLLKHCMSHAQKYNQDFTLRRNGHSERNAGRGGTIDSDSEMSFDIQKPN
jgi:hypothetical protein